MKIQSLLVVSIICFFCTGVWAEETAPVVAATPAAEVKTDAVATGVCKDGSQYTGKSKRGACRGHGGVKEWFADKQVAAPAPAEAQPVPAAAPVAATSAPAPAPVVATPVPAPVAQPSASAPTAAVPAPSANSGKVWVNTHSKIYHCEGSKFYGKTKTGEYMTEADAQAKGFVANRKKICKK